MAGKRRTTKKALPIVDTKGNVKALVVKGGSIGSVLKDIGLKAGQGCAKGAIGAITGRGNKVAGTGRRRRPTTRGRGGIRLPVVQTPIGGVSLGGISW